MTSRRATDKDRAIGAQIKGLRIDRGMTQQDLASLLCVTYQLQHKREKGICRISAGTLDDYALALAVPVNDILYGDAAPPAVTDERLDKISLEIAKRSRKLRPSHQKFILAACKLLSGELPEQETRS